MSELPDRRKAVGRQLARRREDVDLTQGELAQKIGISVTAVSSTERGLSAIVRSRRSDWERALELKSGTITRAYRDGSDIEPTSASEPTTITPLDDLEQRPGEDDYAYAERLIAKGLELLREQRGA